MTASIPTLQSRSRLIQLEIEAEQRRERPNALRLMRLKRLNLMLRDRIRDASRRPMSRLALRAKFAGR